MNKERLSAYSDAIMAIILTIMVLEIKTPQTYTPHALFEELPYFLAYSLSFLFIGVAWYNHHYMFAIVEHILKSTYWLNNLWLFCMSLLPVATDWAGEFMTRIFLSLCLFIVDLFVYGIIE